MKHKLSETELEHQHHHRAMLLAKLIGERFGSANRKRAQRVFKEPSRMTMWAISITPLAPKTRKARMVIRDPIHGLYLRGIVLFVRYLDRRRMTLREHEKTYSKGMKNFLDNNDSILDQLVDTRAIKKYDGRIAKDIEYGGDDSRNLNHRARTTLVSVLLGTPQDIGYPQISSKITEQSRWQEWLGIKPGDSPVRVLWKAFIEGKTSATNKIREIFSYLTARDIAREQGYNKGRLDRKTIDQLVDNGIVHKAGTDESGNVDQETIMDQHSLDDIEQIENSGHDAIIEALARKGIAYKDLTP